MTARRPRRANSRWWLGRWVPAAFAALAGLAMAVPPAAAAQISLACGAVGAEARLCREGAEAWAAASGHNVRLIATPASSSERLALYQQLLAAQASDIDVLQVDVIWPGILGHHLVDLSARIDAVALAKFDPKMLRAQTVDGRLVALPWFADVGLLYFRADLLAKYGREPPDTWDDLTETAALVQAGERSAGEAGFWGFVWQGRAYEGLTCNALEWIASSGGGTLVDDQGDITIDNPDAIHALERARSWVGTISPPGVLAYQEEEARALFQSGRALFMRNWPYAWALANGADSPVRGKVGVSALPKGDGGDPQGTHGGAHRGALGGQGLAVSRYAADIDAAVDLVAYLTSAQEQRRRALAASFNPTRPAVYADEVVKAADPILARIGVYLAEAVVRPAALTGRRYPRVSSQFWNAVHDTLAGNGGAAENLKDLEGRLDRLKTGGHW